MKKVIVNLDENMWHGKSTERLWTKELNINSRSKSGDSTPGV